MNKITFLLGIHNHQPIGNFDEVFEEAYRKSYKPFMEVLWRHPAVKWNLHCTGILWDWLAAHHADYLDRAREMAARGQVELLSGGFYEPILAILPDADKIGQIQKLSRFIETHFGTKPQGMWCAERVWEPHLPKPIREAGIEYTVLDDTHFLSAGLTKEQLSGYYKVEEQGLALDVFPISQDLRYLIPFSKPEDSIDFMKKSAQSWRGGVRPALVMADDGEKFGLWPKTFELVYEEGWLEKFLTLIEKNSDWLETATFAEFRKNNRAVGRTYLPTASYFEM